MSKTKVLLVVLFLLCGCAGRSTPIPPTAPPSVAFEEAEVFAALVRNQFGAGQSLVIRASTSTDAEGVANTEAMLQYVLKNTHGLEADTVKNFRERNATTTLLASDMNLGVSYVLLNQGELDQIFALNQDGWQVFFERYPNSPGLLSLSRVGFNARFDQALVYLGIQSQWLNGSGHYFLLSEVKGSWSIDQMVQTWIS